MRSLPRSRQPLTEAFSRQYVLSDNTSLALQRSRADLSDLTAYGAELRHRHWKALRSALSLVGRMRPHSLPPCEGRLSGTYAV